MRDLEAIERHAISYNTYGFIGLKLNAVPVIPQQNASPVFYVLLHLYIVYFPDGSPYWLWVHLRLFGIHPVFVPMSASMSDALILPFTFSSECFHLIGAYRLWLSDSEYKREHLRELHIKKPSRYSLLVFQTNFLFFSFLKPHNLDGALLMITEVPLAIAWDPGFPTRGPWRYSRGAMEKISYIKHVEFALHF